MPLPEELHMPSLADLGKNQGTLMLNLVFARGGPRDDLLRRHFVNLVRLVDLSVMEYELARTYLVKSLPGAENRLGAARDSLIGRPPGIVCDHSASCAECTRYRFTASRSPRDSAVGSSCSSSLRWPASMRQGRRHSCREGDFRGAHFAGSVTRASCVGRWTNGLDRREPPLAGATRASHTSPSRIGRVAFTVSCIRRQLFWPAGQSS